MPTANTPEDTSRLIGETITVGDIDAVLSLYEPNATFAVPRGFGEGSVTGTGALREAFSGLIAMSPELTVNPEKTLLSGDTALIIGNWTLKGRDADGNDIDTGGRYADVVRRQRDGSWLFCHRQSQRHRLKHSERVLEPHGARGRRPRLGRGGGERDPRFDRAAARFAARVITERRLRPLEAHPVLALAQGLPQAQETTGTRYRFLRPPPGMPPTPPTVVPCPPPPKMPPGRCSRSPSVRLRSCRFARSRSRHRRRGFSCSVMAGSNLSWQRISRYARRRATVNRDADRHNGVATLRSAPKPVRTVGADATLRLLAMRSNLHGASRLKVACALAGRRSSYVPSDQTRRIARCCPW